MSLKRIVGKNIKVLRKRRGLTQSELAEKLGMNKQNISQIERGVYVPSTTVMLDIASLLHCTPNDIFLGEDADSHWHKNDHEKYKLDLIEDFITTHIIAMSEIRKRTLEVGTKVVDQRAFEKQELLKLLDEKYSLEDIRDVHKYISDKKLGELITTFQTPFVSQAQMGVFVSERLQMLAEDDEET